MVINEAYIKLTSAALAPVLAAVLLYLTEKKTPYGEASPALRQVLTGVLFGALAILGTEWGIPFQGAQLNCRDAAVLIAGLMFGAPAGIIAGFIGGVERWIAVAWGVGSFTRMACAVSTILAGFYAAVLRRFMFENKKPGWSISLAIGVVMEVFHLTMVFITNMDMPNEAMAAVKACAIPMITANGLSVMLAAMLLAIFSGENFFTRKRGSMRISQTIQRYLLMAVVLAFAATSFFVYRLQDELANVQADSLLDMALDEVQEDIYDASDSNLLRICREIGREVGTSPLGEIAAKYDVAEISLVGRDGIISESTDPRFVGFDMASGEQSAEFLCLLEGEREYAQPYMPISYDQSIMRKYGGVATDYGFLQVGYDAERMQRDVDNEVVGITRNRHVGESGFIFIISADYQMVSAPKSLNGETPKEQILLSDYAPDSTFAARFLGDDYFCRYRMAEGYYLVSAIPVSEALQLRNIALYVNSFMEILVFAILFGLIYMLIKRVVVDRIKTVNASLTKITGGDLDVVVNVRSNEEFASLSDDINSTVDTLKNYIAEASARIDQELELAKNIQFSALPNQISALTQRKDFDLFAIMDPAKEVGGDFYDYYLTHSDTLNFLIADVSGKGIPAAMFMMRAKTELHSLTEADMALSDVFTNGNTALCEGNDAGMFVTAWQGSIDLLTGQLQYANAGHNPPLIRRANGKFEYLRSRAGFVLAGMEGIRYRVQELQLERGDEIFLYTDGVTEATNAENELFGEDRLLAAVNATEFDSMLELCAYVRGEVDDFVGDAPQFDDITMVAFRYNGMPALPTIRMEEASAEDIPAVTEFVETELQKLGCPRKVITQLAIAIDEIYSNVVKYGYPDRKGPVTVQLIEKEEPHNIYLRFSDEGVPYNPLTETDPDTSLPVEEREMGGLGIFMVKKTMDDIRYKYENGQNVLTVMKNLG